MPARHELATSRWSWLAIIPTCLAKIDILVPARGDCGSGGNFASKARHGGVQLSGDVAVQVDRPSAEAAALAPGASVAVSLPAQPVLVAARRVS
jgi:hypothetical protein